MADGNAVTSPRENADLTGHGKAERALIVAFASEKMHHAWLITGPKGIGKATLAFRFARYVLGNGVGEEGGAAGLFGETLPKSLPESLYVPPEDPIFRRVATGGHADLLVITRGLNEKTGKMRSEIVVDDVRGIGSFLSKTSAEGGWRVIVIDAADEMNRNAANAVLKLLEEPPSKALLLLVSHNPGRLLPTIRSRCRVLALRPLEDDTVSSLLRRHQPLLSEQESAVLAKMAEGSFGRAIDLAEGSGLEIYDDILGLFRTLPGIDLIKVHTLGDKLSRTGNEDAFETFLDLFGWWLGKLISVGARAENPESYFPGKEADVVKLLLGLRGLDQWLEVWEKIDHLFSKARGGNLDRKQVVLNCFLSL